MLWGRWSRRHRILLVVITAVVVIAVIIGFVFGGRIRSVVGTEVTLGRCHLQADRLAKPWSFDQKPSGAAPASPFAHAGMFVSPYSSARTAADAAKKSGNAAQAALLGRIADQPTANWFTDPSVTGAALAHQVAAVVTQARQQGKVATLVAYNIPLRDCGGYSAGGASSAAAYVSWIKAFAEGLRDGGADQGPGVAVILEPDALGLLDNLPADRQTERLELLRGATTWLSAVPGTAVYLDAGTVDWLTPQQAADRLSKAGVAHARGFALNVSNFYRPADVVAYGRQISSRVGWKHFVVDTSRSGNGPLISSGPEDTEVWCNPQGRALGPTPRADPAAGVDAYLWVKPPGESDGDCGRNEPKAGQFWPAYADQLAHNAGW